MAVSNPNQSTQAIFIASSTNVKHALYAVVAFFSFILFIVSCVVVPFELNTYGGYNPPAAELAFTGGVGAVFIPLFIWAQRIRPDSVVNSTASELALCTFMWFFLLGGVGALTAQTYELTACQSLFICRGFSTMMAFAWMSWILITLFGGFIIFVLAKLWSQKAPINWQAPLKELYLKSKGDDELFPDPAAPEKSAEHCDV